MVQEEVLQEALEETMQAYPGFRVVMRKGLFGIIWKKVIWFPMYTEKTGLHA